MFDVDATDALSCNVISSHTKSLDPLREIQRGQTWHARIIAARKHNLTINKSHKYFICVWLSKFVVEIVGGGERERDGVGNPLA